MREKQSYKTKYSGESSIFHPKNPKIEDIFQGCLRFLDSKGTNGSAPLHRQKLARMILDNKWYEAKTIQDSGFFTDLQSRLREKIV